MKKLICVAAAFAMVAGVATVASAEVNLSGDARARVKYKDTGLNDSASITNWDSRVRFVLHAKTESGAYVKARLRFLDGTWGLGNEYSSAAKGGGNVWSDYAFLGFKAGNLDVAAGKMPAAFSPFFLDDERRDRLRVLYKAGGTAVGLTYDKRIYEYKDLTTTAVVPQLVDGTLVNTLIQVPGNPIGGDKDVYGVTFRQMFSDTMKMGVRLAYVNDGTNADRSGLKAAANVDMTFAANNVHVELAYKDGDAVSLYESASLAAYEAGNDQWGGYASWNAAFGAVTPTVIVGYTADGYTADETFGFIMVGGDLPTSIATRYGQGGDSALLGANVAFQASEALSFQGNLAFLNIDNADYPFGENPFEISGQAEYMVGKGISLLARFGYLGSDGSADDALAGYGQMAVSF